MRVLVALLLLSALPARAGMVACQFAASIDESWANRAEIYDAEVGGAKVGTLVTNQDREDPNTGYIVSIRVEPEYRREGISTQLFAQYLNAHPETTRITAELMWTNLEPFIGVSRYNEMLRAAERTPFVRALSRFGFTHVVKAERKIGYVWIEVTRE